MCSNLVIFPSCRDLLEYFLMFIILLIFKLSNSIFVHELFNVWFEGLSV